MEKKKWSMVLFLVSGILVLANSALLYYVLSVAESALQSHKLMLNATEIALMQKVGPSIFALPITGLISGIVLLLVAYMINKNKSVKVWASIGIIFSLLSIAGNGGFIIGFLLGIIAGVLAFLG